jgi:signal transduction histidine kinase
MSPGRRRLALTVVVAAVLAAVVAIGAYAIVRQQRLDAFAEATRRDSQVVVALLVPSLTADDVSGLLAAYRATADVETIAVVDGQVRRSAAGLSLQALPGDAREPTTDAPVTTPTTVRLDRDYLLVTGRPARPDTTVHFLYPRTAVDEGLVQDRPWFVMGWAVTVLAAILVTHGIWRQRLRRVAAARERERRFTSDLAHELRTPLGSMVTAASLLEPREADLPDGVRRPATVLVQETRRLRRLVEDLMELARLEAGSSPDVVEELSVSAMVDAVVAARGFEDTVVVEHVEDVAVEANRSSMTRVCVNLLGNAVEHGGGTVRVRVDRHGADAVVTVTDDGPGIPDDELPHVFERFWKSDGSRSRGGSGLGLAIAREHARLLDGELAVTSQRGVGTTFTLRLPAVDGISTGSAGRSRRTRPS